MNLLDYLRAERGRTSTVAKAVGISPAYLSQIANGLRPCPHKRALAIEQACDHYVTRRDLCHSDWHTIWPDLNGAPDAAHHRRPNLPSSKRSDAMRPHRSASQQAPPFAPPPVPNHGQAHRPPAAPTFSSLEELEREILRMAGMAAELAAGQQKLNPKDAALAVIDAYRAAHQRLYPAAGGGGPS